MRTVVSDNYSQPHEHLDWRFFFVWVTSVLVIAAATGLFVAAQTEGKGDSNRDVTTICRSAYHTPEQLERKWKFMDRLDALVAKIETMIETWLEQMEKQPIKTGVRTLVAYLVIRWVYRRLGRSRAS